MNVLNNEQTVLYRAHKRTSAQTKMQEAVMEIDLKAHYHIIKKRFWIVIGLVLLFTLPATLLTKNTYVPIYQASSEIMVGQAAYPQAIDYVSLGVILKSPAVLDQVVQRYPDVHMSTSALSKSLDVFKVNDSQIMRLIIRDTSYEQAVKTVNYVAQVARSELPKFMNTGVSITILDEAKLQPHPQPINPKTNNQLKMGAISFACAIIVALGLIYLLESLDDTLKTEEEIVSLFGASVIATVPTVKEKRAWMRLRFRSSPRVHTHAKEGAAYATTSHYS